MPCCCGSRVAGSGNPKRSRARRSASVVLPAIGEGMPGDGRGTQNAARASKSRETRRDVAFASGCSEITFPRNREVPVRDREPQPKEGTPASALGPRPDAPRANQTGARGPKMDGRRVKPIGRRGRIARRNSVRAGSWIVGPKTRFETESAHGTQRWGIAVGNQVGPRVRAAAAGIAVGNQVGPKVRAAAAGIAVGNQVGPRVRAAAAGIAVGNQAGPRIRAAAARIVAGNPVGPRVRAAAAGIVAGNRIETSGSGER